MGMNPNRSPLSKFLHCPEVAKKVSAWVEAFVPAMPLLSLDRDGNLGPPVK
jgi:hypothetical protein